MLEYYAQRLGTVEINYTFYRMPNAKIVAGWGAAAPAGFPLILQAPPTTPHNHRPPAVAAPTRSAISSRPHASSGRSSARSCSSCRRTSKRTWTASTICSPSFPPTYAAPGSSATSRGSATTCTQRSAPPMRRCAWRTRKRSTPRSSPPPISATCGCATRGMRRRTWSSGRRPCGTSGRRGRTRSSSSSTRSRGSGPSWRSSSWRWSRDAASGRGCRPLQPVAHGRDRGRQHKAHELGGRHDPYGDARACGPVQHTEVPYRHAEHQEAQVRRTFGESEAARVRRGAQHDNPEHAAEQVVGVASDGEIIQERDAHVDTRDRSHHPKQRWREVIPAQERNACGRGHAVSKTLPRLACRGCSNWGRGT